MAAESIWTRLSIATRWNGTRNPKGWFFLRDRYAQYLRAQNLSRDLALDSPCRGLARVTHFLKYAQNESRNQSNDQADRIGQNALLATIEEVAGEPSAHSRISITDLLNPLDNNSYLVSSSSPSISSTESTDSLVFSDSDVLLGRATWDENFDDDDEPAEELSNSSGNDDNASDHHNLVSFATSSGAEFDDWGNGSQAGMDFDEPQVAPPEIEAPPAVTDLPASAAKDSG
ncbi:hypothetical protein B0H17DRAFT_1153235 [Mycena rosella]|uniref:Uncharacterized protein n=1 Tax=Mycena rosella TaxID=1033263 RepID=A0AAD7B7X7_MYCRO|nr:hypothetical protein B0H17DRAFT_1153235 [Mycena rosella]